jgi:hypothetical protein
MDYNIRRLISGHWVFTFHSAATKTAAVKEMNKMQKEYRILGLKRMAGYDLAAFHGRKKVAATKRNTK